jgi:hypothetical protein
MERTKLRRLLLRGCPRSGNTMLWTMIGACFEGVAPLPDETVPTGAALDRRPGVAVAKYPRRLTRDELGPRFEASRAFVADPPADAAIVFVVRDPRDAMMSRHGAYDYGWFLQSADAWFEVADEIARVRDRPNVLVLRYEDVLRDPDAAQAAIVALTGLAPAAPFSRFHERAASGAIRLSEHNLLELNDLRPVDPARAFAWRRRPPEKLARVVEKLRAWDRVETDLARFGYAPLAESRPARDGEPPAGGASQPARVARHSSSAAFGSPSSGSGVRGSGSAGAIQADRTGSGRGASTRGAGSRR